MSLILNPQKSFSVIRQIANHIDTGTYYVRAVIRYAYTDVLITNLDLDLKGDQRYSKNWEVVADPSGQGIYISIVTSVYTDSGYTTKSENYGDEINTYLIQERVLGSLKSGGGLDMRTTRRIIEESLEKIKFPEQEKISIPKQKEYDNKFNEMAQGLSDIKTLIASIPTENVNLSPLMTRLNELSQEVKTKPVTKETDLNPILNSIKEAQDERNVNRNEMTDLIDILKQELTNTMKQMVMEAVTEATPNAMKGASFSVPMNLNPPQKEKEETPFNIKNLAK